MFANIIKTVLSTQILESESFSLWQNPVSDAIRDLFFFIDKAVYTLIEICYGLIIEIAETSILSNETIQAFANRIYIFIGIFMLFKITVSLVNMMINPDNINDKNSGAGKIVQRIAISLVMLASVPMFFNLAYELQDIILKNSVLENVILGGAGNPEEIEQTRANAGNTISTLVFKSFLIPDPYYAEKGIENYCKNCREIYNNVGGEYKIGDFQDLYKLHDGGAFVVLGNNYYIYDYYIGISTIAGFFTAWVMFMMCFDIAIRSVKLAFLQLIAPVPIIAYMDPKKGNSIFSSWMKETTSTYADVFLRLASLYFGVFMISALLSQGGLFYDHFGEKTSISLFAQVFMIIGILMFMKQLPQLIYDMLGIKSKGSFTLNPLKKIGASGFAAATLAGGAGAALGAFSNFKSGRHLSLGKRLASSVAGGTSAAYRSANDALGGKGNVFSSFTAGTAAASKARNRRRGLLRNVPMKDENGNILKDSSGNTRYGKEYVGGYGTLDRARDWVSDVTQTSYETGTTSDIKNRIKVQENEKRNLEMNESALRRAFSEKLVDTSNREILTNAFYYDEAGNYTVKAEFEEENNFTTYVNNINTLSNEEKSKLVDNFKDLRSLDKEIQTVDSKNKAAASNLKKLTEQLNSSKNKKE